MKQCSRPICQQIKELSEFPKRAKAKDGLSSWCKFCHGTANNSYSSRHKQEIAAQRAIYNVKNKEEIAVKKSAHRKTLSVERKKEMAAIDAANYEKNKEDRLAVQAKYRAKNKEKIAAKKANHRKENPGKINAWNAKRRAQKLKATPKWLTKEDYKIIAGFYIEAAKLTKETDISHHVDHIVPLQGKNVSGLHVPWNLQILPGPGPNGNLSKGNRV